MKVMSLCKIGLCVYVCDFFSMATSFVIIIQWAVVPSILAGDMISQNVFHNMRCQQIIMFVIIVMKMNSGDPDIVYFSLLWNNLSK